MRDYTPTLREITLQHYERLHSNITRDCFSISITRLPSIFTIGLYWRWMFYSLDALYSPVHLYPLRYRRSILTALMRPSLFLCVWFQHYERLHSNITRYWYSTLRDIALVFQLHACRLYWRWMFYSLDALYSTVHLYPLRFRRSILTALMQPSLSLYYLIYTNPKWDSYLLLIRIMLSLCSRNLYSFTLFIIQHFSLCSEKIETHFSLSYLLHHPLSNVLRWSRRGFHPRLVTPLWRRG